MAQKAACEASHQQATDEYIALQAKSTRLVDYKLEFTAAEGTIKNICSQIRTIQNIWSTIQLDMVALDTQLKLVEGEVDQPMTKFFWNKMQPAAKTYKGLRTCLLTYVEESRAA